LQETRPIWEQVLTGLTQIETRLTGVETRFGAVEDEVANLNLKFRVFNNDLLKIQHKQDALDERVPRLESEPAQ